MKYWRHAPRCRAARQIERTRPEWFAAFLADRGTRKPSAHTLKAHRQDFDADCHAPRRRRRPVRDGGRRHHHRDRPHGVRAVCAIPRGGVDSAVLVDLERVVYLPLYAELIGSNPMPMVGPAQTGQDTTGRCGGRPGRRPAAAAAHRLEAARPGPDPDRAAGRVAPINWCAPTSVTFAAATTGPSSMCVGRGAKTAGSRACRRWCR